MNRVMRFLVLIGCTLPTVVVAVPELELVEVLRDGGHVLFIPHTQARTDNATDFVTPPGCPPGTRLSKQGWQNALAAGLGLLKQGVRVEEVFTSPVCAVRHTAYLLFGADKARLDESLTMDCAANRPLSADYAARLAGRLSEIPPHSGFNMAIVGHACGLKQIAGNDWPRCAAQPGPGEVVVFKPEGKGFRNGIYILDSLLIQS